MDARLSDFLTELNAPATAQDVARHLIDFMESQGSHAVHAWLGLDMEALEVGTFPDWWAACYFDNNYDAYDHIRSHCERRVEPIFWGVDVDSGNPAVHPKAQECSRIALEGFGLRNAVVFPVHVPNRKLGGGVSFGVGCDSLEFRKLLQDIQPTLHVAAMAAHVKMQSLLIRETAESVRLSNRERECLLWLAKGLRTARIAERLYIKDVSVIFYVGKAKKKLGVFTREQAVAKAIMLGIIEP